MAGRTRRSLNSEGGLASVNSALIPRSLSERSVDPDKSGLRGASLFPGKRDSSSNDKIKMSNQIQSPNAEILLKKGRYLVKSLNRLASEFWASLVI